MSSAAPLPMQMYSWLMGEDGRFQIKNLPSGTYDWEINAAGYFAANYSNYDVDSAEFCGIVWYASVDLCVSPLIFTDQSPSRTSSNTECSREESEGTYDD